MASGLLEHELEAEAEMHEHEVEAEAEMHEHEVEAEAEMHEHELEAELEAEGEFEHESEAEFEMEHEVNPVSKVYPDAMMEHMAHMAMEAETEAEAAEGFLPLVPLVASKLVPLAARALPRIAGRALPQIARQVSSVTPRLVQGINHLTRALHRNPQTRHLIRAIPSIARRAVTTVARRAAAGQPVTPQMAARILTLHRRRLLSNPMLMRRVLGRSNVMDRRYHRMTGLPWWHRRRRYGYRPGRFGYRTPVSRSGYPGFNSASGGLPRLGGPGFVPGSRTYGRSFYGPYGVRRFGGPIPGACPRCGTRMISAPRGSVIVISR
jgi:hypothetical protein